MCLALVFRLATGVQIDPLVCLLYLSDILLLSNNLFEVFQSKCFS